MILLLFTEILDGLISYFSFGPCHQNETVWGALWSKQTQMMSLLLKLNKITKKIISN